MKIHGITTVKNEASRYLLSCLEHTAPLLDSLFTYDDQSTDGSADLCSSFGNVEVRPDSIRTFIEHEGEFRQASWEAFERVTKPSVGDYVFAFDVDEFWHGPDLRDIVKNLAGSGIVRRPEMYSIPPANPVERVDGFWAQITNVRLFPYAVGGQFNQQDLAGGSHPMYADRGKERVDGHLLHYGYAHADDRQIRYHRYINRGGHNTAHMKSIIEHPKLIDYENQWGKMPEVRRGND